MDPLGDEITIQEARLFQLIRKAMGESGPRASVEQPSQKHGVRKRKGNNEIDHEVQQLDETEVWQDMVSLQNDTETS